MFFHRVCETVTIIGSSLSRDDFEPRGLCKVRMRTADADGGQRTADYKINNNKIYKKLYK